MSKSRRDTPDVLSMLWICQYAPDLSAYVPMYVGSEKLSKAWITGSVFVSVDLIEGCGLVCNICTLSYKVYNSGSAWWNFCVAGNYVSQFYSFAIKAIRDLQNALQTQYIDDVKHVEKSVITLLDEATGRHSFSSTLRSSLLI